MNPDSASSLAAALLSRMERIGKAMQLHVEPQGRGVYVVSGGAEPHNVNLRDVMVPACDCGDHLWRRERTCAHIAAARMYEGMTVREIAKVMRDEDDQQRRRAA